MEPGSNPNPAPFEPRVKRSHWTVLIVVLVVLLVGGGWLVVKKVKQSIGWYRTTKHDVVQGNYGENLFHSSFSQAFDPSVKKAKLIVNGGDGVYMLGDTTGQLLHADAQLYHSRYALNGRKDGAAYGMDLSMKSKSKTHASKQSDSLSIALNAAPVWDISVNTGAGESNFDLSKYKVSDFKIAASAGAFIIKAGQPMGESRISVMMGAGDITINVPKNAACRITQRTTFSSSVVFSGFDKKSDGSYETPGYSSAHDKILIRIMSGAIDLRLSRY